MIIVKQTREEHNAKIREKTAYLKAHGLCCRCSKPAVPGRVRCKQHLQSNNDFSAVSKAKNRFMGKCRDCGRKAVLGKLRCRRHLEEQSIRRRVVAKKRREKGLCLMCGHPLSEEIDKGFICHARGNCVTSRRIA